MTHHDLRTLGDIAAIGGGGGLSLAYLSNLASSVTPFFTLLCAILSAIWLAWRLIDRALYGPGTDDE